jgi:hypothetical protein
MMGLGMIFLDIVRDNPTIKNKAGTCAFCYIVNGLGCMCQYTDLHKATCGCTKCVGLHTLHCSLQAKRGVMHCQIAIDDQCCTTKIWAKEMAWGWAMLRYMQHHWKQSGWAPALDGVRTTCRTESIKCYSAVLALCTLCQQRRRVAMWVPRKSCFMYTSIKSCCTRTARSTTLLS